MPDLWLTCDHYFVCSVRYGSTSQPSFPPGSVNVNTWITGVETINRQIRAAYGWLVVGQSVGAGLTYSLQAVCPHCLWHEQRRCSSGMRLVSLYGCYMLSPLRLCCRWPNTWQSAGLHAQSANDGERLHSDAHVAHFILDEFRHRAFHSDADFLRFLAGFRAMMTPLNVPKFCCFVGKQSR